MGKIKLLDYTKIKFVTNWASGVALVGAITWAVTVTVQNKGYKTKIDTQGVTIRTLDQTVNTLRGSMETVNNVIRAFTENPPSALEAKIDGIYKVIEIYHGRHAVPNIMNQPSPIVPDSINAGNTMGTGVLVPIN